MARPTNFRSTNSVKSNCGNCSHKIFKEEVERDGEIYKNQQQCEKHSIYFKLFAHVRVCDDHKEDIVKQD